MAHACTINHWKGRTIILSLLCHPQLRPIFPQITVDQALAHPYLSSLHSPEDEATCPEPFDFSFEAGGPLNKPALQRLIWEQIAHFHPEVLEHEAALQRARSPQQLASMRPRSAGSPLQQQQQPQQAPGATGDGRGGQPQQPVPSYSGGGGSGGYVYGGHPSQQQMPHGAYSGQPQPPAPDLQIQQQQQQQQGYAGPAQPAIAQQASYQQQLQQRAKYPPPPPGGRTQQGQLRQQGSAAGYHDGGQRDEYDPAEMDRRYI